MATDLLSNIDECNQFIASNWEIRKEVNMWNRGELKQKAKDVLRGNYWNAFLVSLVVLLTGGGHNNGGGGSGGSSSQSASEYVSGWVIMFIAIIVIIFLLIRILVGYALEIGGRKYFISLFGEEDSQTSLLGYGFKNRRYTDILLTMLLRDIFLFGWFLLLVIPGLIKSYSYRMTTYILAENPSIGKRRAIELSREMTYGEKLDIFVLDLSFIGWYILGVLALGVGVLFVQPYYDATNAALYLKLREKAINNGLTSEAELSEAKLAPGEIY